MATEPARTEARSSFDLVAVAEPLGYAGAAVSLAAAALVVVNSGSPSRTSAEVASALAVIGLVGAGVLAGRSIDVRAGRIRSVFWFLAAIGVFELMLLLMLDDAGFDVRGPVTSSAAVATVAAVALWWFSRRCLQQVALFGLALLTLLAAMFPDLGSFFLGAPDFTSLMVVALVAGAGWFVLGWRGLAQPPRTAMVLGSLTVAVSPVFLVASGNGSEVGVLVALLGVALLVVGQLVVDRAVSGIGVVAVLWGSSTLVTDLVAASDSGAIVALVLGLVMVGGAIVLLQSPDRDGAGRPAALPPSPPGPPPAEPVPPPQLEEPPGSPPPAPPAV